MHILLSYDKEKEYLQLELSDDLTVGDLKAIVEVETKIAATSQTLIYKNEHLNDDDSTLSRIDPIGKDTILLEVCVNCTQRSQPYSHKEDVQNYDIMKPRYDAATIDKNNMQGPNQVEVFDFAKQNNLNTLKTSMTGSLILDHAESQNKILESIRQRQIEDNLQLAFDISPESFIPVNLLYIKLRINDHEAFALVDTGAQQTILHPNLAEKFGVSNLVDRRFASNTVGVGTQRSEGRIHSAPVTLGDMKVEIPCSFTILNIHVGILFGLDMLKRHKCNVDLITNSLVIEHQHIRFMTDYEIERVIEPWQIENRLTHSLKESIMPPFVNESTKPAPHPRNSDIKNKSLSPIYSQNSISKITSLGFSEEEAIEALSEAGGNVELAASSLF